MFKKKIVVCILTAIMCFSTFTTTISAATTGSYNKHIYIRALTDDPEAW